MLMQFHQWIARLDESSLITLYQSTEQAFPRTRKRQYATDLVKIVELNWSPYLGVRTLFIRGRAESGESGKEYQPMVLFKGVRYHPTRDRQDLIEFVGSDGRVYVIERLSYADNDVLLRCDCADFRWRFNYYDHLDKSLYGSKRRRYESAGGPPANPKAMPGMCKHLIKLVQSLDHAGLLEG
jgi:hypothetical protein